MKKEKHLNLLLIVKNNQILLALKKRGFGQGLYNGCGGKVEKDETIEESVIREAKEELGITPIGFYKVAINIYDIIYHNERTNLIVHVFMTDSFQGEIKESEEMKPQWFDLDKIPYQQMWSDDPYWLPNVLRGEKLKTYFLFDDKDIIKEVVVNKVDIF